MKHPLSVITPIPVPDKYLKSKIQWVVVALSTNGLAHIPTWKKRMAEYRDFVTNRLPDIPYEGDPIHYLILLDILSDGTGVWLEYPTRLGWTDCIWTITNPFITVDCERITKVSYYQIADILWAEKEAKPVEFAPILQLLQQYSETGVKPDPVKLKAYKSTTGNDMERVFAAIGAGYIEQYNKNSTGQNMLMSYALYPPTYERISQSIDMRNGKLTLLHSLHMPTKHHMDFAKYRDEIETRWKYTSKDKHKELYYTIDGYLPGVDGPAHITYTRIKPFVIALGKNYSNIFLDDIDCVPGELRLHLREERGDQVALMEWFDRDIKLFANKFDGATAYFDYGYARLDGNGKATLCLYQDWTEKDITSTINRKQKITKHKIDS